MFDYQNFDILKNRFEDIKMSYREKNYPFIHVKTVDNFLFHFNSIPTIMEKVRIYERLSMYFDIINSYTVDNQTEALELFNEYIRPVVDTYKDDLGFHLYIKNWILVVTGIILGVAFYLLHLPPYFHLVLVLISILLYVRQLKFVNQNKTYAFLY